MLNKVIPAYKQYIMLLYCRLICFFLNVYVSIILKSNPPKKKLTTGRVQSFISSVTRNRPVTSTKPSGTFNGLLVKFATVVMMHGGTNVQNSTIYLTELWANVS